MDWCERNMFTYNNTVDFLEKEENVKFCICPNNVLRRSRISEHTKIRTFFNHIPFTIAFYLTCHYLACIEYKKKHFCNIFPVALCSHLDKRICHGLAADDDGGKRECNATNMDLCKCKFDTKLYSYENILREIQRSEPHQTVDTTTNQHVITNPNLFRAEEIIKLSGCFIFCGRLVYFANILTNNSGSLHEIKKMNNLSSKNFKKHIESVVIKKRGVVKKKKKRVTGVVSKISENDTPSLFMRKFKTFIFYSYDDNRRGHVFKITVPRLLQQQQQQLTRHDDVYYKGDSGTLDRDIVSNSNVNMLKSALLIRSPSGKNYLNEINAELADADFGKDLRDVLDFSSHKKIQSNLEILSTAVKNIDFMSNKLILNHGVLLKRLVKCLHTNSNLAYKVVSSGNWYLLNSINANADPASNPNKRKTVFNRPSEKVLPVTIIDYNLDKAVNKRKKNTDTSVPAAPNSSTNNKTMLYNVEFSSNVYKKITPSSMLYPQKLLYVTRISPYNISSHNIPLKCRGILCFLDKGISLDSFNKQANMCEDVKLYTHYDQQVLGCCSLGRVLKILHHWGVFTVTEPTRHFVCINGGLPTKYYVKDTENLNFIQLFFLIKSLNEFVEIINVPGRNGTRVLLLNNFEGVPFKPVKFENGPTVHMSSNEMYSYLIDRKIINVKHYYTLFCPMCPRTVIDNLEWSNKSKILYAINHEKNIIHCANNIHFNIFTESNTSWGISEQYLNEYNTDDNFIIRNSIKKNVLIAVDPYCTQDGYLGNLVANGNNSNTAGVYFFLTRYSLEIELDFTERILPCSNKHISSPMLDSLERLYLICEIQNKNKNLNILKNHNVKISTLYMGSGCYSHYVYIIIPFDDSFDNKFENFIYSYNDYNKYSKGVKGVFAVNNKFIRLQIDTFRQHWSKSYDGEKITNLSSSKGIVRRCNLDERYNLVGTKNEGKLDIVVSPFSALSRCIVPAIIEMKNTKMQLSEELSVGESRFQVLNNLASLHSNYAMMRFDNNTVNMLRTNGCPITNYNILQQAYPRNERFKILPKDNKDLISMLQFVTKKTILYKSDYLDDDIDDEQKEEELITTTKSVKWNTIM